MYDVSVCLSPPESAGSRGEAANGGMQNDGERVTERRGAIEKEVEGRLEREREGERRSSRVAQTLKEQVRDDATERETEGELEGETEGEMEEERNREGKGRRGMGLCGTEKQRERETNKE